MLCINFFIATAFPQMLHVTGSVEVAKDLNSQFAAFLPAGGIVYIPLIGTLLCVDVILLILLWNSTWGTLMLFWMSPRNLYSSQLLVKLSGLRCLSTWTRFFSHKAFKVEVSSSTDWAQQWAISYCKQHMAPLVLFSGDHFMKRNYLPETWRADFIGIDLNGVRRLKILDNI